MSDDLPPLPELPFAPDPDLVREWARAYAREAVRAALAHPPTSAEPVASEPVTDEPVLWPLARKVWTDEAGKVHSGVVDCSAPVVDEQAVQELMRLHRQVIKSQFNLMRTWNGVLHSTLEADEAALESALRAALARLAELEAFERSYYSLQADLRKDGIPSIAAVPALIAELRAHPPTSAAPLPSDVEARITAYLSSGGLFNPELANHDSVRDLLMDCRDALRTLSKERQEFADKDRRKTAEYNILVQENRSLSKDAERLDFMNAHPGLVEFGQGFKGTGAWYYVSSPPDSVKPQPNLRATIDAALAAKEPKSADSAPSATPAIPEKSAP